MNFNKKLLLCFTLFSMTQATLPAQERRASTTNAVAMEIETSPTTTAQEASITQLHAQAHKYFSEGNQKLACETYERILSLNPNHTQTLYDLGSCYFFNEGVPSTLSKDQRYAKAVSHWRIAAGQGHLNAQYYLGTCYFSNRGVPSDLSQEKRDAEGVILLRLAANQGHPEALCYLGTCYFNNRGVSSSLTPTQRLTEGVRLYTIAANQGVPEALCNLGTCYFNNQGVPSNLTKEQRVTEAVRLYTRAANKGLAEAQYSLGKNYVINEGVDSSLSQEGAIRWLTLATNQGHSGAAWLLAQCFINGIGVSRNYDTALKLYEQAIQTNGEKLPLFYKMYKKRLLPQCSSFENLAHRCFTVLVNQVNPEIHEKLAREKKVKDQIEATKIESHYISSIDCAAEPCPICQVNFEVNQKIMLFSNNSKSCFHALCQNCLTQLRNSNLIFRCPLCREVPTNVSSITVMPPATQACQQQNMDTQPTEAAGSKEAKVP